MRPSLRRWCISLSSLVLVGASALLAQPASLAEPDDSSAARIRRLYEEGAYSSAELEGRRSLDQPGLGDSVRIQIEKYIAFSLIAQDRAEFAESHFLNILQKDSTFALDPQLTSPKILNTFEKVQEKYFAARPSSAVTVPGASRRNEVTFRTALFPGWEQLYRGRTTSGYTFLSAGTVEVMLFVYCDAQRSSARDSYLSANTSELASSRYTTYNRYYKGEIYSAAVFGITYLLSEVDVLTFGREEDGFSGRISAAPDGPLLSLSLSF